MKKKNAVFVLLGQGEPPTTHSCGSVPEEEWKYIKWKGKLQSASF